MSAARSRPLRVLHCPALVGGHAEGLARAERALGLDSRTLVLHPPPFGYQADEVLFPTELSGVGRELRRWRALFEAARRFDVVHFNFGSTLMPRWYPRELTGRQGAAGWAFNLYARLVEARDMAWLKRAGLGVFITYQGDDVRQASSRFDAVLPRGYFNPSVDRRKRRLVARAARHADGIYALNPDLLELLPARAEFLPYVTVDLSEWRPVEPRADGPFVVAHAPTDRRVKGTEYVIEAVADLRSKGLDVELLLVEGMTRAEARGAYERCDVLVDQLLTGWYGAVAVELMALAKPVVAHIDGRDLARVPAEMSTELPVIRAIPASLVKVLEQCATTDRRNLAAIGARGRAYVERWHNPVLIASRLREVYERSVRSRAITTTST